MTWFGAPGWVHGCAIGLGLLLGRMHLLLGAEAQMPVNVLPRAGAPASVQPIPLSTPPSVSSVGTQTRYQVTVNGNGWQPAGVVLAAGGVVELHATGRIALSDGHAAGPDGVARGWTDLLRLYPLSTVDSGALIGRVGTGSAATPFLIGSSRDWTAPASGPLYLRINLSPDLTAEGDFHVSLRLRPPKPPPVNSDALSKPLIPDLSAALFADIPRRVTDRQHHLGDMVNFALVGTEQQVQADLAKAGWITTDPNTEDALMHGLLDTLSRKAYTEVPMSTLYLFGRPEDLAYARANPIQVAATRDHMRLWKTAETVQGLPLWVGSATRDHGFETDQRTGGVTHHIDPNIDRERDFILANLNDAGQVQAAAYVLPSDPVHQAHTATGGSYSSDGRILVVLLR